MRVRKNPKLIPLAFVVAGLVGAASLAGIMRGMWADPGDGPFAGVGWLSRGDAQTEDPIVAERGLPQVVPPDPVLRFPPLLRDLPASPFDLAFDTSGALWFVLFDGPNSENTLYRYDTASDSVRTFAIPRSQEDGFVSEIEVDERDHVIWAVGDLVLDFDPKGGTYKEHRLGPSPYPASFIPPAGVYITAMDLDGSGHAYLSRMNVSAVAEIDLASGKVREIPYPEDFGAVRDLAAVGGTLWITNPYDWQGGPLAHAGKIDLTTGAYEAIDGAPAVFAEGGGGKLYGTSFAGGGLAEVKAEGLSAAASADGVLADLGVPDGDVVVVDQRSGVVWASGSGLVVDIVRFDPTTGGTSTYPLGKYLSTCIGPAPAPGQPDPCDTPSEVSPLVSGMAVAPNGDLYFADSTFNRIGMIHAGQ